MPEIVGSITSGLAMIGDYLIRLPYLWRGIYVLPVLRNGRRIGGGVASATKVTVRSGAGSMPIIRT